jgi:hypothetical protein
MKWFHSLPRGFLFLMAFTLPFVVVGCPAALVGVVVLSRPTPEQRKIAARRAEMTPAMREYYDKKMTRQEQAQWNKEQDELDAHKEEAERLALECLKRYTRYQVKDTDKTWYGGDDEGLCYFVGGRFKEQFTSLRVPEPVNHSFFVCVWLQDGKLTLDFVQIDGKDVFTRPHKSPGK